MNQPRLVPSVFAAAQILLSPALIAGEEIIQDAEGMSCYVYTPDDLDAAKTYQLVVGVHGAGGNGNGAAGLKGWAQRGDVIVIGPSFQTKGERPYQNGDGPHAEKLIKLFKDLGKKYKLEEKMFIHGFSGGSQFGHRFTMLHPEYVCGLSAHSGGSWATDGFGTINIKAKKIPMAISCGEADTAKSWATALWGRLDWFKRFEKELDEKKFTYISATWPGVGHRPSPGMHDLLKQCFQLATGLPGESATEKVTISENWKNLDGIPTPKPAAGGATGSKPYVDPNELAKQAKAAFAIADKGIVDDEKLVTFMEKYPPVLWRDMEGSANLLKQCQAAAKRWKEKAETAGTFSGEIKGRYEKFSNGLGGGGN